MTENKIAKNKNAKQIFRTKNKNKQSHTHISLNQKNTKNTKNIKTKNTNSLVTKTKKVIRD